MRLPSSFLWAIATCAAYPQTKPLVARKLDEKYLTRGIRGIFCDEMYEKANADFDQRLAANSYPASSHTGIPDTAAILYLGGDKGWIRKELVSTALGDLAPTGDARRSTPELGKRMFDTKVEYAVHQIPLLLSAGKTAGAQS